MKLSNRQIEALEAYRAAAEAVRVAKIQLATAQRSLGSHEAKVRREFPDLTVVPKGISPIDLVDNDSDDGDRDS